MCGLCPCEFNCLYLTKYVYDIMLPKTLCRPFRTCVYFPTPLTLIGLVVQVNCKLLRIPPPLISNNFFHKKKLTYLKEIWIPLKLNNEESIKKGIFKVSGHFSRSNINSIFLKRMSSYEHYIRRIIFMRNILMSFENCPSFDDNH